MRCFSGRAEVVALQEEGIQEEEEKKRRGGGGPFKASAVNEGSDAERDRATPWRSQESAVVGSGVMTIDIKYTV
jgi:hypothetical protein